MATTPRPTPDPNEPTVDQTDAPEDTDDPTAEGQAATFDFMPEQQ